MLVQGWSFVFVFTSMLGLIGIVLLARLVADPGSGPPRALGYLGLLALLGNFVAGIAILVGQCLCLAIPSRSGAKGWIIGAISFLVAMVVLFFMMGLSGDLMSSGFMNAGMARMISGIFFLWLLTPLGYTICFHIFLRQASLYVGRDDLGTQALIVLIGPPVTGVLHTISFVLIGMIASSMDPVVLGVMAIILSLFFLIAYVVFAVMHVALLFRLGAAMK